MKTLSVALTLGVLFGAMVLVRPVQPVAASTAAASYMVDGTHSSVIFRVMHMNVAPFYGRFNEISGTFDFDPNDASKLTIDVQIKAESIDTHSSRRDGHLKGPDFFNAKEYPTIRFKSRKATKDGAKRYKVAGDLTLHGVTRPVTLSVEHTGSGKNRRGAAVEGFEVTFTVKRSEFGMRFMLGGLSDEVRLMAGIEGARR